MIFTCECRNESCKEKIDISLDEFLEIERCLMISENCSNGADETDIFVKKKDGYSLYKGTL